jgi:threonine dehydrogenase-like Zn-dependent dehydrogenase
MRYKLMEGYKMALIWGCGVVGRMVTKLKKLEKGR